MDHSIMVGKSKIDNVIVTNKDMVTLTIDKGQDLTDLIQNLEASRRDSRTTGKTRLWIKNGKIWASNRFKAGHGRNTL
jgi:hypothetical protein